MAMISIADAARSCGKDRRTIERHLKSGVLSYTVDATGKRVIDTSELIRVYGTLKPNAASGGLSTDIEESTPAAADDGEKIALRAHIATLERHIDELREEKRELRAQVVGLLEYRRTATAPSSEPPPTPAQVETEAQTETLRAKDTVPAAVKATKVDLIYLFVGIVSVILAVVLLWVDGYRPWFML